MVPGGRKHSGKSGKPPPEDHPKKVFDFEKENKDLSGSEEDVTEENTPGDKRGKKRPSLGIVGDTG